MAVPLNMLTLQRCQERKKAPPAGHRDADSVRWPAGGAYARLFKASALSYALQATARPLGALLMPQASQAPLTAVVVAMMPSGANRKLLKVAGIAATGCETNAPLSMLAGSKSQRQAEMALRGQQLIEAELTAEPPATAVLMASVHCWRALDAACGRASRARWAPLRRAERAVMGGGGRVTGE